MLEASPVFHGKQRINKYGNSFCLQRSALLPIRWLARDCLSPFSRWLIAGLLNLLFWTWPQSLNLIAFDHAGLIAFRKNPQQLWIFIPTQMALIEWIDIHRFRSFHQIPSHLHNRNNPYTGIDAAFKSLALDQRLQWSGPISCGIYALVPLPATSGSIASSDETASERRRNSAMSEGKSVERKGNRRTAIVRERERNYSETDLILALAIDPNRIEIYALVPSPSHADLSRLPSRLALLGTRVIGFQHNHIYAQRCNRCRAFVVSQHERDEF